MSGCAESFDFPEKIFYLNTSVTKRALQRVAVNFVMEWENNDSSILMFHLYVTTFSSHFYKSQTR